MKKVIAMITAVLLFCLCVAGCSEAATTGNPSTLESNKTTVVITPETTVPRDTTPATIPTTQPTAETSHTHSFSDATCTEPKTCSCGETEGVATGHQYDSGVCVICGGRVPDHSEITYVLNVKSMKFHYPSCKTLPTDNRLDTTMSREEVIEAGYSPCGNCKP